MMITLGNSKAMKTFQRPTMFESFSEIEHNRIDCTPSDGQLVETSTAESNGNLMQSVQAVQSRARIGNQRSNFSSGSRVKVKTTLISISPPSSPTNHLSDTSSTSANTGAASGRDLMNNGTLNSPINGSANKDQQTSIINYDSPSRKQQHQTNKKHLIRCESVDSINHMNGYSSVSSCSTVINRPTVQKVNWNVCQSNCNSKLIKCQLEDAGQQSYKQYDKSTRLFNSNDHQSAQSNRMNGMNKSKTVDNISNIVQPQQQHQSCPQYRQEMQQKITTIQRTKENKSKEKADNTTNAQVRISVSNQSKNNNQQANDTKQAYTNNRNIIRTTNVVNTGYALPQLTTQPLIAIRRILLLYENLQYKETAQFITRLQNACFQLILRDLPVGLFIEQMPQSLVVLEALYAKLYASLQELDCLYSNGALIVSSTQLAVLPELNPNQSVNHTIGRNLLKLLQPESVTMHLVKMFALKSHTHHSIYDCTSLPSTHNHTNVSNGVFSLMQERFDNNHPVMITMKKLLKTILTIQPPINKQLAARKRAIDNAIDALGHHGLVSTGNTLTNANAGSISSSASSSSSSSTASSTSNATSAGSPVNGCASSLDGNSVLMMSLHEALKLEFDYVIQQYKHAVQKLEEAMSSANTGNSKQLTPMKFTLRNLSKLPAPSSASHQRQLSLRSDEIQLRLVRNKSLLNSLEQYVLNQHSVQILIGILEQRINYDKETLFQFTQLRKEFNYCCTLSQQLASSFSSFGNGAASHGHTTREPNPTMCVHKGEMNCCIDANAIVAPVLLEFSFGCGQVLRVFEDISAEMLSKAESETENSKINVEKMNAENVSNNLQNNIPTQEKNVKDNTTITDETGNLRCVEFAEADNASQINKLNRINLKTVINNDQSTNRSIETSIDQFTDKEKHAEQLDNEETRQSSSDISGYHSDENTDFLSGSIQSNQQNSGCLDGKRVGSQNSHFFSRSSSSPLSSASYSSSCSSDLRNDELNKKSISPNLVDIASNQDHDLTNVQTPIGYLDNERSETCWTPPQHSRYSDNELIILKRELIRSKQTIFELQEREQQLLIKLKHKQPDSPPQDLLTDSTNLIPKLIPDVTLAPISFSPQQSPEKRSRPCALIRRFGDLYSQARVDTLDSLDLIEQLKDADELKSKLLFSVVVLSFRSIQKTITEIKQKICTLLQIYDCNQPNQSAIKQLETSINTYFEATLDTFDTTKNLEEVCNQIWTTLYDYPCLKDSSGLNSYINDCVKLAWALSVQSPAYLIKFDSKLFDPDYHVRFHISDSTNSQIKNYLWPALIEEGDNGVCVHKGVVIT